MFIEYAVQTDIAGNITLCNLRYNKVCSVLNRLNRIHIPSLEGRPHTLPGTTPKIIDTYFGQTQAAGGGRDIL